jgi:hypothetical protein
METALECCAMAIECERKAEAACGSIRSILLEAAASWRKIGDDLKAKEKWVPRSPDSQE